MEKDRSSGEVEFSMTETYLVLTPDELRKIKAYKYKPGTYTHLDEMLSPYWNWAVTFLPLWYAPNLVTLTGLLPLACLTVYIVTLSPDITSKVGGTSQFMFALFLFFYQTMDAIDGKQARRTNSSSPLGQLFDHGCDALALLCCTMVTAAVFQLGASFETMLIFCNVEAVFFLAQWEEYHTGTLNWSNGFFGTTESQFIQMFVFVVTSIWGVEQWFLPVSDIFPFGPMQTVDVTLFAVLMFVITFTTSGLFISAMIRVFSSSSHQLPSGELGDKVVGFFPGLIQLLPFAAQMSVGFFLMTSGKCSEAFERHAALYLFGIAVSTTHIISRMIIHHMAKNRVLLQDLFLPGLQAFALSSVIIYFSDLPVRYLEYSLHGAVVISTVSYVHFVVGAIIDLCAFLNISCFRIKSVGSKDS